MLDFSPSLGKCSLFDELVFGVGTESTMINCNCISIQAGAIVAQWPVDLAVLS